MDHSRAAILRERRRCIQEIQDVLHLTIGDSASDKELLYLMKTYYLEIGVTIPPDSEILYNIDAYRLNESLSKYEMVKEEQVKIIQVTPKEKEHECTGRLFGYIQNMKPICETKKEAWVMMSMRADRRFNQHKPTLKRQVSQDKNVTRLNKLLEHAVYRNKIHPGAGVCKLDI
jgi:hypothetical protein